jgi:hypothetical protein
MHGMVRRTHFMLYECNSEYTTRPTGYLLVGNRFQTGTFGILGRPMSGEIAFIWPYPTAPLLWKHELMGTVVQATQGEISVNEGVDTRLIAIDWS